ncbi:hypothetical protein AEA09_18955 [Lysinibacillus contaminans]|uniref:DUF2922 domain-containing protein n=1 Tax=Lysinibacillus contaminans TaxID=1293441 RepID=A0ABR5JWA7_9BACI|nr:DUF2922 domain-containing protein [Lysinibacillus contaminans]KOS66295.1 hypothetical protein AEA09_18955 [Lysinibacillus contaminans]
MSNATTREVLVMEFKDLDGKIKSIRVADPKTDLTAATVEAAMEVINDLNVFNVISGRGPATIKGAKSVQTVTNNFDIVVG